MVNVVITNNFTGVTAADYMLNLTYPAYSKKKCGLRRVRTFNVFF